MKPSYKKFDALLNQRGLKPVDVKNALGLKSQSVFSDWKSNKSYPKIDKLMSIAKFLDVSIEELLEE